ncbi:MAG: L-histidine N(alpha)-methyltransferase [archaeon]|nr:L-histidine N(alpha)-methyltransferase [archaeon]
MVKSLKPNSKKNNSEINDLIFRELLKRGYSLEGNTRIWNLADSKLWYLTPEQAQAFLDLEQSKDYQKDIIQKEIDLIKINIRDITENMGKKPVNLIDLGCGDGKKAVLFMNHLKNAAKLRYCPIDISAYMVEKAIERVSKLNISEVVKFQWNISDFENLENITPLLRSGEYKHNFILLLGNTLGNFEIHELLYGIRSSMKDDDVLLIGNGLDTRHINEILKAYDNPFLDDLLVRTLTQIGLKKEDIKYGARFRNSRVEMYYTLQKDVVVSFLGRTVNFNYGDQIIVAVSYKYRKEDFMSFLKMYFSNVELFVSKDGSYSLALCKK